MLESSPRIQSEIYRVNEPALKHSVPRALKNTLTSILKNYPLRYIKDYYTGLGSFLLYHRVLPNVFSRAEHSPYNSLAVTKDNFEKQIRYCKENFHCLSLGDAVKLLYRGELPKKTMVVTFDDGYKDNFYNALPVLEKYGVPATVYVTTGLIDRTAELWWYEQEYIIRNSDELDFIWQNRHFKISLKTPEEKYRAINDFNKLFRNLSVKEQKRFMSALRPHVTESFSYDDLMLTWDELKKFDSHPLITIGAHTKNHPMLSRLDETELARELKDAKLRLEAHLGHEVEHLAYPFGAKHEVGAREFRMAKSAGYFSAVTTRNGHIHEAHQKYLHILPRITVNYDDELETFAWKLSGVFAMIHQRGKRLVVS